MPPSGFVPSEVSALTAVADSLLARFETEVKEGVHPSHSSGIEQELKVIARELDTNLGFAERGVLLFVEQLYQALQAGVTMDQFRQELHTLPAKQYK